MSITKQTMLEMEAGARALASVSGKPPLEPDHIEAVMRTADRAAQLDAWHKEGRVRLEKMTNRDPVNGQIIERYMLVHLGDLCFDSREDVGRIGSFPSELLIAKIALALAANQDHKEEPDALPL